MPSATPDDWLAYLTASEQGARDDWVDRALLPVARLAAADPVLSTYFPIRSLNRLCFSSRPQAPTNAEPCIGCDREGRLAVQALPYPDNVGMPPDAVWLGDASSPEHALEIVKDHLPRA